jgi:hypothetical protein
MVPGLGRRNGKPLAVFDFLPDSGARYGAAKFGGTAEPAEPYLSAPWPVIRGRITLRRTASRTPKKVDWTCLYNPTLC